MAKRGTMSRRRAIGIGISGAVAIAASNHSVAVAAAGRRPRAGEPAFAEPAVVNALSVVNEDAVLDGTTISTRQRTQARLLGFPGTVRPRADDMVTLSDRTPTRTMAAFPLCRWVTAVPRIDRQGSFIVGPIAVLPTPELIDAAERKRVVLVCVLDTLRTDHQILAIRQPN